MKVFWFSTGETSTEYNKINIKHYDDYVNSVLKSSWLWNNERQINELKDLINSSYNDF